MRIVIAPDSMKGCLRAKEVAAAIAAGLRDHEVVEVPLSDGGEGFVEVLTRRAPHRIQVQGINGTVDARVGERDGVQLLEAADVVGLPQAPILRPLQYTTFGIGELLRQTGRPTLIGLGGSATIDGGLGMMRALGARFWDSAGRDVKEPAELVRLSGVENLPSLRHVSACADTEVSLAECASTFGPQKGANPAQITLLEEGLDRLASICDPEGLHQGPRSGAAGGLGFALSCLGATLLPGFSRVAEATELRQLLTDADLCITAEGTFDQTSLSGKLVGELAAMCQAQRVPCAVLTGQARAEKPDHVAALVEIEGGIEGAREGLQRAARMVSRTFNGGAMG